MQNIFTGKVLDEAEEETLNLLKESLKASVKRGHLLRVAQIAERFGQRPSNILWPDASHQLKLAVDTLLFDLLVD